MHILIRHFTNFQIIFYSVFTETFILMVTDKLDFLLDTEGIMFLLFAKMLLFSYFDYIQNGRLHDMQHSSNSITKQSHRCNSISKSLAQLPHPLFNVTSTEKL